MFSRLVKGVVLFVVVMSVLLVGVHVIPMDRHSCLVGLCIYADKHGYAGLMKRDGTRIDSIEQIEVYTSWDRPTQVRVYGASIDDFTVVESAKWMSVRFLADYNLLLGCEGEVLLTREQIKKLEAVSYIEVIDGYINNPMGLCRKIETLLQ